MQITHRFKKFLMVIAIAGGLSIPAIESAVANIMIMPVRVSFGPRDRMQDITVLNNSQKANTYRLSWLNVQQDEYGSYQKLEGPLSPELDPAKALLFSPQQVTLGPNGKQRVRLALRRPADLPEGEYRAHLQLKNLARQSIMNTETKDNMAIGLGMQVGVAIPVIIRHGKYDATASIGKPSFIPAQGNTPPLIKFYITRKGKFSTNGRLRVYWHPPGGGEEKLISELNGFNIFHEVPGRNVKMPLRVASIVGGSITILFEGDGPDEGITFDEKTFPIGG